MHPAQTLFLMLALVLFVLAGIPKLNLPWLGWLGAASTLIGYVFVPALT